MGLRLAAIINAAKKESNTTWLIVIFFGLSFLGLFFGDGKQAVVEVYVAAVVLILWTLRLSWRGQISSGPPRFVSFAWAGVFAATILSAITSDSVGFSLSWLIRLLCGYLVYRLFYEVASEKKEAIFSGGLLAFVGAASIVSLIFMAFPAGQRFIPSMNLVSRSFGHNHLADLLVFVSPLVWNNLRVFPARPAAITVIVYTLLLFSTLARAAWALVTVFFAAAAHAAGKKRAVKAIVLSVCLFTVLIGGYFTVVYMGAPVKKNVLESYMRPRSATVRLEYWRQAMEGFIERPITGSGPGTFSLVSWRYQRVPFSASWFAHSQPLQILAETGVVGFAAFGMLLFAHARHVYVNRKKLETDKTAAALLMGCALIVIYSLFEFVLDYFIVWLLLLAVSGFVTGITDTEKRGGSAAGIQTALIVVSVYYLLWIGSNGVGLFTKRHDLAFYLAPFDSVQTLLYLEQSKSTRADAVWTARLFHRKNPQILEEISENMQNEGNTEDAIMFSRDAAFADPQNTERAGRHFSLLAPGNGNTDTMGKDFLFLLGRATPARLHSRIDALLPQTSNLGALLTDIYRTNPPRLREGYVSFLYLLGLRQIPTNMWETERLWRLAVDVNPDYAPLYIELAMYYQHIRHNDSKAQQVLRECIKHESPKEQCENAMNKELLPPGDYFDVLQ